MRRHKECTADTLQLLKDVKGPDARIKELLPRHLRDLVYVNRKSSRVEKIRHYFSKFTERWYRSPGEDVCDELLQVSRYLQLHLFLYSESPPHEDDTPIIFFNANVPEVMLDIIRHSFSPDFLLGNPFLRRLPYLALQILGYFFHNQSQTFLFLPDRVFADSSRRIDDLVEILHGKLTWFEGLAVVHLFGLFSLCPAGVHWYQSHPDTIQDVCELTYRASEIIEEKISQDKISWRDDGLANLLTTFRDSDDLIISAKLFGLLTTCHAIRVFSCIVEKSKADYEKYLVVTEAVKKSEVMKHFSYIVKRTMTWVCPGQYLHFFLEGVYLMLEAHDMVDDLFLDNLAMCVEKSIPVGIESFKYWKHTTRQPAPIAFYLVHAFALSTSASSSYWCIFTLCHLLNNSEKRVSDAIIEHYGQELMDLAHLVEIKDPGPEETGVQAIVLEALLRYGGFTHKAYAFQDTFESTVKPADELPDFCLEAALFAKKAQCEAKMSTEEKQKRVGLADLEKDQGNAAFKEANYNDAIIKYTNAIAICPLSARTKQSVYYSNRAECYLRVNDAKRAVHDCNRALCLDISARVKVQWRRSRAYQKLNLDYPAWLDLKCLEKEWRSSEANSGINFYQLLSSLTDQVGVYKASLLSEMERKLATIYH